MGKSKKKKTDFQKVKFKVGKKLPRGLNETVATFKTRSIEIKNQSNKPERVNAKGKRLVNLQV